MVLCSTEKKTNSNYKYTSTLFTLKLHIWCVCVCSTSCAIFHTILMELHEDVVGTFPSRSLFRVSNARINETAVIPARGYLMQMQEIFVWAGAWVCALNDWMVMIAATQKYILKRHRYTLTFLFKQFSTHRLSSAENGSRTRTSKCRCIQLTSASASFSCSNPA